MAEQLFKSNLTFCVFTLKIDSSRPTLRIRFNEHPISGTAVILKNMLWRKTYLKFCTEF
jgi:hypothetical protein